MIIGNIQQLEIEKSWLPNAVYKLLKQVIAMHPETLAPGRYELGQGHYMNVDEEMTEPEEARLFEVHQEYADVQMLLIGHEHIYYAPLSSMDTLVRADMEKDLQFYEYHGKSTIIPMLRGSYAIFFPGDAHKPLVKSGYTEKVKKVVIKVNLANVT